MMFNTQEQDNSPKVILDPLIQNLQQVTLENGIHVSIANREYSPTVTIAARVNQGSNKDPIGKEGLAHFLEHTTWSCQTRDFGSNGDLIKRIYDVHGYSNAWTRPNSTEYVIRLPSAEIANALHFMQQMLFHVEINDPFVENEKNVVLAEESNSYDSSDISLAKHIFDNAYLGIPVLGRPESINNITTADLSKLYNDAHQPNNLNIAVVGAVPNNCRALIESYFAHFIGNQEPQTQLKRNLTINPKEERILNHYKGNSTKIQMLLPFNYSNPNDRLAVDILCTILNSRKEGFLWSEFREKSGLVYSPYACVVDQGDLGYLEIGLRCTPKNTLKCLEKCKLVFDNIREAGLSDSNIYYSLSNMISETSSHISNEQNCATSLVNLPFRIFGTKNYRDYFNLVQSLNHNDINAVVCDLLSRAGKYLIIEGGVDEDLYKQQLMQVLNK